MSLGFFAYKDPVRMVGCLALHVHFAQSFEGTTAVCVASLWPDDDVRMCECVCVCGGKSGPWILVRPEWFGWEC